VLSGLRYVPDMKTEEAITYAGSVTGLAALLKVTTGAVSQWRKLGTLPGGRQLQLEQLTGGALLADPDCMKRPPRPKRKKAARKAAKPAAKRKTARA
jgi:hypothetical protein